MIRQEIKKELEEKLKLGNPLEYTLDETPENIQGDLGTNLAIMLSKTTARPLNEISEEITRRLEGSKLIRKVETAGRGFLNFHIAEERLHSELQRINNPSDGYPEIKSARKSRILIEFVSSNPTGPLHIGHGRCAVLGDALARLFSIAGHSVNTEYYMNDTGTQMDILGETVKLKCLEILGRAHTPEENAWIAEKGYKGRYIDDIAGQIIVENNISSAGELQQKHTVDFFGKTACRIILGLIKDDLLKFNIVFDSWVSENSLHENKLVAETMQLLKDKGVTYENEGALWFKSTAFGDEKDRVLVRKTGQTTYFANDIAYHRTKYERGYDRLINILGADHHSSVQRLASSLKALGYDENKLSVLLYQFVSLSRAGKTISMSTRAGEFITLKEVIDEIGPDACRYFLLMRSPDSHLKFDLELAKKQTPENPVYYIQYAHTRCCGVLRQYNNPSETINYSLLNQPQEIKLMKKLLFYQEILDLCLRNLSPHYLTTYLLDLAGMFHRYYDKCRIISDDKEASLSRIFLVKAVKNVLGNGLSLLGIKAPEKM